MNRRSRTHGFTLVELLVVISILGVLFTLCGGAFRSALNSGRAAAEKGAARQVMIAYLQLAHSNNGTLMPGYAALPATDDQGREIHPPVSSRYPWRLAPALDYNLNVLYGDKSSARLRSDRNLGIDDYQYSVSVTPAFGINGVYVGGDHQVLNPNGKASTVYGDFCVTRADVAASPAGLLVFASACLDNNGKRIPGYFRVEAPNLSAARWEEGWRDDAPAHAYGQVDFRHDRKAVATMLDGHVTLIGYDEARDMRLWSNLARISDNPGHTLGSP